MSATLQEVALAAGVSAQTVSRVINNQPHVSGKARRKVLEAIRLLGYTPSESARILRSGGRMKLGNGMMRLGHIVPPLGKDYWHFERERLQLTEAFIRGGMIQTFCLTSDVLLKDEHLFHYMIDPAKVDALFITMCSDELREALESEPGDIQLFTDTKWLAERTESFFVDYGDYMRFPPAPSEYRDSMA